MEAYKEKLKISKRIYTVTVLVLAGFYILVFMAQLGLVNITPVTGNSRWIRAWHGMMSGAAAGIIGNLAASISRISKALRNEKELKKRYVKENDERLKQVTISARALSMQIFLMAGVVAAIVAGYFNVTVSITILSCVAVHCLLGGICKLYYSRKF